jgi:hypothetical protein
MRFMILRLRRSKRRAVHCSVTMCAGGVEERAEAEAEAEACCCAAADERLLRSRVRAAQSPPSTAFSSRTSRVRVQSAPRRAREVLRLSSSSRRAGLEKSCASRPVRAAQDAPRQCVHTALRARVPTLQGAQPGARTD